MRRWLSTLWPHPERISAVEQDAIRQDGIDLDARIKRLRNLSKVEPSVHLEAARRISDEEDRRKSGAETRATTFIASVAALIPLMTWALGNTGSSICSMGWGCFTWTVVFDLAVVYFVSAAYWALRSLAVANYHVIGVEDIVQIREDGKDIYRELIQQTLLQARKNRDTINQKLTYIKIAQRRFFNGLAVLGLLLMFDPVSRFGVVSSLQNEVRSWGNSIASAPARSLSAKQLTPPEPVQSAVPQRPLPTSSQPLIIPSSPKTHDVKHRCAAVSDSGRQGQQCEWDVAN